MCYRNKQAHHNMKIEMTVENIDVRKTLDQAKKFLGSEKNLWLFNSLR